jgi:hypothetical protein
MERERKEFCRGHGVDESLAALVRYRMEFDGLATVWLSRCEESVAWSVYEETIRAIVTGSVEALPAHEAEAVWLQTDDARETREDLEMEDGEEGIGTFIDKVVDYIIEACVYRTAHKWHNARIEAYLDGPTDCPAATL